MKKDKINRYECDNCGTAREGKTWYCTLDEPIRGYTVDWDNGEPYEGKKGKSNPKRETKNWWFCSIECVREWSGGEK